MAPKLSHMMPNLRGLNTAVGWGVTVAIEAWILFALETVLLGQARWLVGVAPGTGSGREGAT